MECEKRLRVGVLVQKKLACRGLRVGPSKLRRVERARMELSSVQLAHKFGATLLKTMILSNSVLTLYGLILAPILNLFKLPISVLGS